jgi:serine/threonine protein phosphatase 1
MSAMWSRKRFEERDASIVEGLRALIVGHNCVEQPLRLGNVLHIDSGAWIGGGLHTGPFCIIDAATLEPVMSLDWAF